MTQMLPDDAKLLAVQASLQKPLTCNNRSTERTPACPTIGSPLASNPGWGAALTRRCPGLGVVQVTLFGGCVTSWKTASGDEVLYIRPDAVFDKSKPISGGIPHCWPQVTGERRERAAAWLQWQAPRGTVHL